MRFLRSLFILITLVVTPCLAKPFPFACWQSEIDLTTLTESGAQEIASALKDSGMDGLFVVVRDPTQKAGPEIQDHLAQLDQILPPGSVGIWLDLGEGQALIPDGLAPLLASLASHPCILRAGDLPMLLLSAAEDNPMVSLAASDLGTAADRKAATFWVSDTARGRPAGVTPVLPLGKASVAALEERSGTLRQVRDPVCLRVDRKFVPWEDVPGSLKKLNPDCLLIAPGPVLGQPLSPSAQEVSQVVQGFKEGFTPATLDVKYLMTDVQGEPALEVTLMNRTPGKPIEASVTVSAADPVRVLPQSALIELDASDQLVFKLASQSPLAPGNYGLRIQAEAGGYQTVLRAFHKAPLVCPGFFVLPKVDGDLSDWGKARSAPLTDEKGNGVGKIVAGWTRSCLLMGILAEGVGFSQKASGNDVTSYDCVRIGLDPLWDQQPDGYNFDDIEIAIGLGKRGPILVQTVQSPRPILARAELAMGISPKGVVYEMALYPLEGGMWRLEERTILGVAVSVKATSRETQKPMTLLWGDGLTEGKSPALFGVIGLGPTR